MYDKKKTLDRLDWNTRKERDIVVIEGDKMADLSGLIWT